MTRLFIAIPLALVGCGGHVMTEVCGAGTHDRSGECVPNDLPSPVSCGPGTHPENTECLPGNDVDASNPDSSTTNDASSGDSGVSDGIGGDAASFVETACLVDDNIFVLAGDDFIHTGPPLIIRGGAARWGIHTYALSNGLPSYVDVSVDVSVEVGQQSWNAEFSTKNLSQ